MADKFENKKPMPHLKQQKLRKGAIPAGKDVVVGGAEIGNLDSRNNDRVQVRKGDKDTRTLDHADPRMNTGVSGFRRSTKSNLMLAGMSGGLNATGLSHLLHNSQPIILENSGNAPSGINLFTHQKKRELEGTKSLVKDYENLKVAVLELYLSVKIRSDEEIDDYSKEKFMQEKKELQQVDGYELIDSIKGAIEQLMNMKGDESGEVSLASRQKFGGRDIDDDIEIDLPQGAKDGLKDATQKDVLGTDHMQEQLQKSLVMPNKTGKKQVTDKQAMKKNAKKDEPISGLVKDPRQVMNKQENLNLEQVDAELLKKLNQNSMTNDSQTTSIQQLQNKLQDIASPSSSKPDDEDDYYQEAEDGEIYHMRPDSETNSEITATSIPMAHREYEKILRQLESECRTHIKCEQQMKLHIECLQEKLDQTQKDADLVKDTYEEDAKKVDAEHQIEIKKAQSEIQTLKASQMQYQIKIQQLETEYSEKMKIFQVERQNDSQKINQLEMKLERTMEQNQQFLISQGQLKLNQMNNSNQRSGNVVQSQLGIKTNDSHNLTDSSQRNGTKKVQAYSDFQTGNIQHEAFVSTSGQNQSIKGTKYNNDIRKQNQRSQSVLKSHTEFNHNFGNYQGGTSGSIGSSTTQRAITNNLNQLPNSKSTAKMNAQQVSMRSFSTQNVNQNSKHTRSKKHVNQEEKQMISQTQSQSVILNANSGHRQSISSGAGNFNTSGNHKRQQQLQSSQNLKQSESHNPYRVDTFSKINLNQNLNQSTKINGRAQNNKSAIAYNNMNAGQKEQLIALKSTPERKNKKQLKGKFDQSDIEHLGSVNKNYITSDPKSNGFQASMNLMDNGGKLQKIENSNTDIPQMTHQSSISASENHLKSHQYLQSRQIAGGINQSSQNNRIMQNKNIVHLKHQQQVIQNNNQQNMYIVNPNGIQNGVVTTSGQGPSAQLKISSSNFNVSGSNNIQSQQQLFLASGINNQNQAQKPQTHSRSITKLEKSNYNSNAQVAAQQRSKSNGRQHINSYGKLQTSKQFYDSSATTRDQNTIQNQQTEALMIRRDNNKSGRVVNQLVNIYQNNPSQPSTGPIKTQNKFTNQLSDRYNTQQQQQRNSNSDNANQNILPNTIGNPNHNTESISKKYKQNSVHKTQKYGAAIGAHNPGSKSMTVDASNTKMVNIQNNTSMTKLDKNKY